MNVFGNINVNSIVDDEKSGVLNVSGNINVGKFLTVNENITSDTITTRCIFVGFDDGDSDNAENNEDIITYEDGDIVATNKIYAKTLSATNDISTKTLTANSISATDITTKTLTANNNISTNGEITTNKIKVGGISVGKNNNKYTINDGEIIVDKIIANSEVNNQVVINGNDIRIISNDGTNTALFTSDDIQLFTDENNIISNKYSWNTLYTGVDLSSNNEQIEPQTIESYYSEFINLNGVFGDSNLNLKFKIIASMSDSEGIISDWNFNATNSLTLYIEQYNVDENIWEETDGCINVDLENSWFKCDEFGEKIDGDSENENGYFLSIADANINYEMISDKDPVYEHYYEYRGSKIYRVKTVLDTSTIDTSNLTNRDLSNINILLKIVCDTSIRSHLDGDPNTQRNGVVIGKNGIIVRTFDDDGTESGTNGTFYVSKNEILMRVGNFALKICKDGIYKTQDYESCYNIYPTDDESETWKSLFE